MSESTQKQAAQSVETNALVAVINDDIEQATKLLDELTLMQLRELMSNLDMLSRLCYQVHRIKKLAEHSETIPQPHTPGTPF